ncbi:MAG: DUF4838 domain-containing protein [Oscillospiraceae bacterium]|nr:DUF4838 domain-containing protein [Oscillospiraceae bacterium]
MTKLKATLSGFLAVVQMALTVAGITNTGNPPVNYGGTPRLTPVVTNWLTLIDGGESDYIIIYGNDATESEKTAAKELQSYLEKISGVALPTYPDSVKMKIPTEICVGKTTREGEEYKIDRETLGDEGFTVKIADKRLVIAGGELRGTLYGVYSFLEEQLGCRWFTPELTVIPESKTVKINLALNDTQVPVFGYRDVYWQSAFDVNFKVRQKINSNVVTRQGEQYGGGISYADFCHSMERMVPVSYFAEHPEYFSYREDIGGWTTAQRCLTNPKVLEITIENARRSLNNSPGAKIMSITQNDNGDYCQCQSCKASDEFYGGPSGTNLWFTNQVAEALEDEFEGVMFDTFAYQYTRPAPTKGNIRARDNVVVRLCSIECCFSHPLSECGNLRNEGILEYVTPKESIFAKDIVDWADICDNIYIWDYTTNFLWYLMPHPNFQVLSPNVQFFAENNVKGVFEQGNSTRNGEFGELRAYLLAKLLWDPYCDVEYHLDEFIDAYYGKASAPYIKDYLQFIINKTVKTHHIYFFNWHYETMILMPWEVNKCDALWANAERAAGSEQQLLNIRRSHLSYRFYKGNLFMGEFSVFKFMNRSTVMESLYNDMVDLGVTRISEGAALKKPDNFFFTTPIYWEDK